MAETLAVVVVTSGEVMAESFLVEIRVKGSTATASDGKRRRHRAGNRSGSRVDDEAREEPCDLHRNRHCSLKEMGRTRRSSGN